VTQHLVEDVSFRRVKGRARALSVPNFFVDHVDDSIFVRQQSFHFFNLINFLGDAKTEVVESLDQLLLVSGQPLNILFEASDMPVEILDLLYLKLDLLVEIYLLLSDHVELLDLVVDDLLACFKRAVDLRNLDLDL